MSENTASEIVAPEAKAKKEKAPKPVRDQQNGVTRPATGTKTGRVWEISDSLSAAAGAHVARKAVMEAARAEGINDATIATQYGHWRRYNGLTAVRDVTVNVPEAQVKLGEATVETAGEAAKPVKAKKKG